MSETTSSDALGSAAVASEDASAPPPVSGEIAPHLPEGCRALTVDVFDTLLIRKPISERRRLLQISRRISERLAGLGIARPVDFVRWTRVCAQQAAFRLRRDALRDPEVRLSDIIAAQRELLALPETAPESIFTDAELEVEAESVFLHEGRAEELRRLSAKLPVIAISDTTWSTELVRELLRRKGAEIPFTRIYASADAGTTKRDGTIFPVVAEKERFALRDSLHMGDDLRADVRLPSRMGVARTLHLPRPRGHVLRRKADGLLHLATHGARRSRRPTARDEEAFSAEVMGPIVAEFCLRLWAHLRHVERRENACALFCARGGLVMRALFDRFLEQTKLPLAQPRRDLMISRLIAARAAIARNGQSAFDELGREYRGASLADAVAALAGPDAEIETPPAAPFDAALLRSWMFSAEGRSMRDAVEAQNALFTEHLEALSAGADRLALVDTGLYGSTHRLLEDGFPEKRWLSLLIARANYKNLPTPHFPRTIGILSEKDSYARGHAASVVLRYWHLVEDFFEPNLPSVRRFHRAEDGSVRSNLEVPGWEKEVLAKPKLAGVLRYLDSLDEERLRRIPAEAGGAWRRLHQMIVYPSPHDAALLDTGLRSKDFGQDGAVAAIADRKAGVRGRLAAIRQARWKEGSIAVQAGRLHLLPQLALEAAYALRSARKLLRR